MTNKRNGGRQADLKRVQERIGYEFRDPSLLENALTHNSAINSRKLVKQNYQRLEFLGDRVLGLSVSTMLIQAFPNAEEGELAQRYNQLVKNETCAEIATQLDLGKAIALDAGMIKSEGWKSTSLLADVCESLIAAIYIDAGFEVARDFVFSHWRQRMLSYAKPMRDAKSTVHEHMQAKGLNHPTFAVTDRKGPDHNPIFTVEMSLEGYAPSTGKGSSKQTAEQNAAESFLRREKIWTEE